MSVRINVDDVVPATDRLASQPFATRCGNPLATGSDKAQVVDHGETHALLGAVHLAFAGHRRLVLSPDAIWITIAEGVAWHVKKHASTLRTRLVNHEGKERIDVTWNGPLPTKADAWQEIVGLFSGALAERIGEGPARLFECDFSTTTAVERIASQVILMDAYSSYFDYFLVCICGIPSIVLEGTPADWRLIRQRVDVIAEYDLQFWTRSLAPILDEFIAAAEGRPNRKFWKRIYKPVDAYGGDVVTGWIGRLYPWLSHDEVNPLLPLPLDEPKGITPEGEPWYSGPGFSPSRVGPSGSRVSVHLVVPQSPVTPAAMTLQAGILGVEQTDDGALKPLATWVLHRNGTLREIIERLCEDPLADLTPARVRKPDEPLVSMADFMEFYSTVERLTLFDPAVRWEFRAYDWCETLCIDDDQLLLTRIADLADGRFLAAVGRTSPSVIVLCQQSQMVSAEDGEVSFVGDAGLLPVVALSLVALLNNALNLGPVEALESLGPLAEFQR